jgi:hypothetical protein
MKRWSAFAVAVAGVMIGVGAGAWIAPMQPGDNSWCSADTRAARAKVAQVHDTSMQIEHDAMMALVPTANATHIAISDGAWSAPSTWNTTQVPNHNARVLVPAGRTVTFDAASTPLLHWLRIDGGLRFSHQVSTQMLVDTIVVTPQGRLTIGDERQPIAADVSARIRFPSGPIDRNWDPRLLSRGLLAHGATQIRGAAKLAFAELQNPIAAGATQVQLRTTPSGWRVGDQALITSARKRGTMWPAWAWNVDGTTGVSEDEVRTITSISGNTVAFNTALSFPHTPPSEPGLYVHIANLTRNVQFESENAPNFANSTLAARQQRGHVMMMHEGDMRIEYAQFLQLGRTDKSVLVDDPILQIDGTTPGTGNNARGRYPLHFHRSGARQLTGKPALARGNVVSGSPGWGLVNHDSHVLVEDNVSFDVFGAGFVTEIGNELGSFRRNLAVLGRGSGRHIKDAGCDFGACNRADLGHAGHGFWFQGRNLLVEDNIAVSQRDAAFAYFHRSSPVTAGDNFEYIERDDLLRHPSIVKAAFPLELDRSNPIFTASTFYDRAPIVVNRRNIAYNAYEALHIVKSGIEQHHEQRNMFEDLLGWGVINGIHLEYVSQYTFRRLKLYADAQTALQYCGYTGIVFGSDVRQDLVFETPVVKSFSLPFVIGLHEPSNMRVNLIDASFLNHMGGSATSCYGNAQYPSNGVLNLDTTANVRFLTQAQLGSAPLSYTRTQATVLDYGGFAFPTVTVGNKTDRLGEVAIRSVWDNAHVLPRWVGYHRLANGTPVVQLREIYADRIDGSIIEYQENVPIPPSEQGSLALFTDLGLAPSLANAAPVASADMVNVTRYDPNGLEALVMNVNLLSNDTDSNANPLRVDVTWVQQPANGRVALNADGSFVYMPNAGFLGTDQFSYRATDTRADSAPTVVTLNVQAAAQGAIFRNGFEL